MEAKKIVCYGDSNTWGDAPHENRRYPVDVRWVGVLQGILGKGYEVVNEGLNGRTFMAEDSSKPLRSGIKYLKPILSNNDPIDIIIVMLGTNDMKSTYSLSAEDIASHLGQTIQFIRKESSKPKPKILVICPPLVVNPIGQELDERLIDAPDTSRLLPPLYERVSQEFGCLYINAGELISLDNTDGYHFAAEHHKALGEKVANVIQSLE